MHFLYLLIFSIAIPYLPNCVIVVLLYVQSVVVSFVAASVSFVLLENNFLEYIEWYYIAIAAMSTLYGTIFVTCLDDAFSFATITE